MRIMLEPHFGHDIRLGSFWAKSAKSLRWVKYVDLVISINGDTPELMVYNGNSQSK